MTRNYPTVNDIPDDADVMHVTKDSADWQAIADLYPTLAGIFDSAYLWLDSNCANTGIAHIGFMDGIIAYTWKRLHFPYYSPEEKIERLQRMARRARYGR